MIEAERCQRAAWLQQKVKTVVIHSFFGANATEFSTVLGVVCPDWLQNEEGTLQQTTSDQNMAHGTALKEEQALLSQRRLLISPISAMHPFLDAKQLCDWKFW